MAKRYTISDGKMVLTIEEAQEGGFTVSSPLYPGLVTEGETLAEVFINAKDALETLIEGAKKPFPKASRGRPAAVPA